MNKIFFCSFLVGVFTSALLWAAPKSRQVIDLGQLQIDGAARGPEIQLIDTQRAGDKTTSRLVRRQLEELERELLVSDVAPGADGKGAQR